MNKKYLDLYMSLCARGYGSYTLEELAEFNNVIVKPYVFVCGEVGIEVEPIELELRWLDWIGKLHQSA